MVSNIMDINNFIQNVSKAVWSNTILLLPDLKFNPTLNVLLKREVKLICTSLYFRQIMIQSENLPSRAWQK